MTFRRRAAATAALMCLLTVATAASAQSRLGVLLTDRDFPPLPVTFGEPESNPVVNQAGDYVFMARGALAIYLKRAGTTSLVRVVQSGDEVPGIPGARMDSFLNLNVNGQGDVFFASDDQAPTGRTETGIFKFSGTTLGVVALGTDPVPGLNGVTFERSLALLRVNDAGDIFFSATMGPLGFDRAVTTSYFILPAGGTAVRVMTVGDTAPGTGGGAFSTTTAIGLNNRHEALFGSTIIGGNGGYGYFLATASSVTKIVTTGDTTAGVLLTGSPSNALLNNAGQVAWFAMSRIWLYTPGAGIAKVAEAGMPAARSTLGSTAALAALGTGAPRTLNDAGQLVFTDNVTNSPVTGSGLFQYPGTNGNQFDVIAYGKQVFASAPGYNLEASFGNVSMNAAGAVSFRAGLRVDMNPSNVFAIFKQEGTSAPTILARDGDAAPLPGGGTLSIATAGSSYIQGNGAVSFSAYVLGGVSTFGHFRSEGGASTPLMATEWPLPAGHVGTVRTLKPAGDGDYLVFLAGRSGGPLNLILYNVRTAEATRAISEMDPLGGGGPRGDYLVNPICMPVNRNGTIMFASWLAAPGNPQPAWMALRRIDGTVVHLAGVGEAVPDVTGQFFTSLAMPSSPPALTRLDHAVFMGSWSSTASGYFFGSFNGPTQKVVAVGDALDGGTVTSIGGNSAVGINDTDQVVFIATVAVSGGGSRRGLYLWSPGAGATRIAAAGDASPAGGFFASVGTPALAADGRILFMSTLSSSSGARGGVFLYAPATATITAIAVDGGAAPGGGTFAIDHTGVELAVNSSGDVAFRSWLSGGLSDSGVFIRRAADGVLRWLARQGEQAPGAGAVFYTMNASINGLIGENMQMDEAGNLVFTSSIAGPDKFRLGLWRVDPANHVELMKLYGTPTPELGGGIVLHLGNGGSWMNNGRWIGRLRMSGGTFDEGIGIWVPAAGVPTPVGTDVVVHVPDLIAGGSVITATFDHVSQAGETSATTTAAGPAVPSAFTLGVPPRLFELATTAVFTGNVTLCVDISGVTYGPGDTPRLWHYTGGVWFDITTSSTFTQVCGITSSFSFFAVAQVPQAATPAASPAVIWPPNNKMVRVDISVVPGDPGAGAAHLTLMSVTANEPLAPGDIQGAVIGADCRAVFVRASRLGSGQGRVYTFTYTVTHDTGYAVVRSVDVFVPHDQGK